MLPSTIFVSYSMRKLIYYNNDIWAVPIRLSFQRDRLKNLRVVGEQWLKDSDKVEWV